MWVTCINWKFLSLIEKGKRNRSRLNLRGNCPQAKLSSLFCCLKNKQRTIVLVFSSFPSTWTLINSSPTNFPTFFFHRNTSLRWTHTDKSKVFISESMTSKLSNALTRSSKKKSAKGATEEQLRAKGIIDQCRDICQVKLISSNKLNHNRRRFIAHKRNRALSYWTWTEHLRHRVYTVHTAEYGHKPGDDRHWEAARGRVPKDKEQCWRRLAFWWLLTYAFVDVR